VSRLRFAQALTLRASDKFRAVPDGVTNSGLSAEIGPQKTRPRQYNLHVDAPELDQELFSQAVEMAIAAGVGIHIEHRTAQTPAYVLTAKEGAKSHFTGSSSGYAVYQPKIQTLTCRSANVTKIAAALEQILSTPVVNETGLKGEATSSLKSMPKDIASANEALDKELGLALVPAERPIETLTLTLSKP